ncbi:MAG TPA: transglycosylase SLT domain-containing protein [Stellaceae bacterium]|nr:transglycosylase SLT domain-containing protein [Stellaceae bacterium]
MRSKGPQRIPSKRAAKAPRPTLVWIASGDRTGAFRRSLLLAGAGAMMWVTLLTLADDRLAGTGAPGPLAERLLVDIESAATTPPEELVARAPAAVPEEARRAIHHAAALVGVDRLYLFAVAARESSFDADAYARKTTAAGLYQFTEDTWLRVVKVFGARHGLGAYAAAIAADDDGAVSMPRGALRERLMRLRYDPELAALMAAELARDNRQRLERVLGRKVSPTEVYVAHFLGLAQAARMIDAAAAQPETAAARLLPAAAVSNPAVFGRASAGAVLRAIDAYFRDEVPRFARA